MIALQQLRQNSYTWFLKRIILPLGDLAFGQKMMRRLHYLEQAQWWDPEKIARERDRSLQSLIQIAYQEIPYYRETMDRLGLLPGEIRQPEDLSRLPLANKDLLRKNYPDRITRPTGQKTYETRTSGSTGENFAVREDAETAGWYRAAFMLALEWAGWQFGEPHLQTGMTLQRSLDRQLKDRLLRCHYVSAYHLSNPHLDSTLDLLEKHHIHHLWGYPGSLFLLARRALEKGWNQPLRTVVTWGDNLYPHYRKTIEAAFRTQVSDTYGCAEGVQIAAQCEQGYYHIHSLDAVVEFLDEHGAPVQPGHPGRIVVTRLHPGPMPLIRYVIGDVGAGIAQGYPGGSLCPCGRGFPRLSSIQGRDTDIVLTPSGNRLIVHFFTGILEHFPEIDTFQVIQEQPGSITLRIQPTLQYGNGSGERIIEKIREKGAGELEVEIELVQEIPLPPSGKRRFVISKIAH